MNSGSNMCVAVTAAMAFDSTPEKFMLFTDGVPPYSDLDFVRYALKEGYICGFGIPRDAFVKKIDVGDSGDKFDTLEVQRELTPESVIEIKFKLKDYPAYIVVEGANGSEMEHAIYWDGNQVFDPDPMIENGRPLSEYKILRYFPIMKLDD